MGNRLIKKVLFSIALHFHIENKIKKYLTPNFLLRDPVPRGYTLWYKHSLL